MAVSWEIVVSRILRIPKVKEKTGLSRAEIYRREADGRFPKKIHISANVVGFLEDEIDLWIEQLRAERDRSAA
jgi:prophage regulatory protein